MPSLFSRMHSRSSACPTPSAPTTAFPSQAPTRSSTCQGSQSGVRLGITIERIKPGHPQQNGRHERMHLTLKLETTKPAARNFLQQQAKFDDFIECYNNERPHQALDMQYPAQRYRPSPRSYRGLPDIEYPFHDRAAT